MVKAKSIFFSHNQCRIENLISTSMNSKKKKEITINKNTTKGSRSTLRETNFFLFQLKTKVDSKLKV